MTTAPPVLTGPKNGLCPALLEGMQTALELEQTATARMVQ